MTCFHTFHVRSNYDALKIYDPVDANVQSVEVMVQCLTYMAITEVTP